MDYTKFSGTYTVRRLLRDDIPSIFVLRFVRKIRSFMSIVRRL